MSAEHAAIALATALGLAPAADYPAFEQLFGWPLPPGIVPFADMLHAGNGPTIGASSWYLLDARHGPRPDGSCPPFRAFAALAGDGDRALDFFLSGHRAKTLVAGLLGVAEDAGGDLGFVDAGPGAVDAGFWVHNHEVGRLAATNKTFTGFLAGALGDTLESWDDDGDPPITEHALAALWPPAPADPARTRDLMEWWRQVGWIADVIRGDFSDDLRAMPVPERDDALGLHARLLAAVLTHDAAAAAPLIAPAEAAAGIVTRALGARVRRYFAGDDVCFGWLTRSKLAELGPKLGR